MNPLKHIVFNPAAGLFAPLTYWEHPEEAKVIANGCGAKSFGGIVPDTMYGLTMTPVCNIHDCMYEWGDSEWDKLLADSFMLVNSLLRIVNHSSSALLKGLRCYRATTYFLGVHFGGDDSFWEGKERP